MTYRVLYRTYRPHKFKEVVGQKYIVKTLQNSLIKKRNANAYLFCGPRGTGKTSLAKIMAMSLNCKNFDGEPCCECEDCLAALTNSHPDILEFDAASHSKVENIRDILMQVNYGAMQGSTKVYIIDEVHMLSTSASNALLKTLEEPPANTVFILATTESQKVLPTIQSRCQRYDFAKIDVNTISKQLEDILDNEKVKYDKQATQTIASLADGGMRDALSILEQCLAYGDNKLDFETVREIYGLSSSQELIDLLTDVYSGNSKNVVDRLQTLNSSGADMSRLCTDLIEICKEALIYNDCADESCLNRIDNIQAQQVYRQRNTKLLNDIETLLHALRMKDEGINIYSAVELSLLKMCFNDDVSRETNTVSKEINVEHKKEEKKIVQIKEDDVEEVVEEINKEEDNKKISEVKDVVINNEPVNERIEYSANELANILALASKEEKIKVEDVFNEKLNDYAFDPKKRRYYSALVEAEIFASAEKIIILNMNDEADCDEINDEEFNLGLYDFLKEDLKMNKLVYAITKQEFDEDIKSKYLKVRNNPVDIEIKNYSNEIKKEKEEAKPNSTLDNLRNMFGDGLKVEE